MKKALLLVYLLAVTAQASEEFVVPERIKNNVDFWSRVYRDWDSNQVVFYDEKDPRVVYHVMSLPKVANEISSPKYKKDVQNRFNEIADILKQVESQRTVEITGELAANVLDVLKRNSWLSEQDLAKRLRYQNGLRSQFEYGLRTSGRYADDMKAVLRAQGLPEGLIALVFVESLFYLSANSHAGASGPWGFVKETGLNSGIHVNNFVDERLDPVVATWGASQFLKKAKAGLLEWPLAITAYNYGYAGMLRAVSNLGTRDFNVIVDQHESPIFGYASKNYYAEFLAALEIYENYEKYFPGLVKEPRWEYELVQVARPVGPTDLVSTKAINIDDLIRLNPSLTSRTVGGHEVIPPDYALRVPKGRAKHFYDRLKKVPGTTRKAAELKISSKIVARGKETLYKIAKRLGISANFLSEKMGKPLDYQPKGAINIRSQAHLFSPLLEINKVMFSAMPASRTAENESSSSAPVH